MLAKKSCRSWFDVGGLGLRSGFSGSLMVMLFLDSLLGTPDEMVEVGRAVDADGVPSATRLFPCTPCGSVQSWDP